MAEPLLSVVIPTFNRAHLLERTLTALDVQEGLPDGVAFEVVVVDDGSSDGTAECAASHPGVVYLYQANAGPAAARNRGWSKAAGSLIAFTDDDTVPDRRWLADLVQAFAAGPGLDAVGGTVRPLHLSFLTRFVQAEAHASHGVAADGRIKYLVTANCAYRRSVLEALGGFDETFPAASGEDTDLTIRAQAAGYRMGLVAGDRAVVLHDHPRQLRPILKTYRKHGRSRRLVIERNPGDEWGQGPRDVLTLDHWRRRHHAYRDAGLGRVAAVAALGLRVVGVGAYGVGIVESKRTAGRPTIRVVIACPGADHVARGYERVGRGLERVLGRDRQIKVTVVKGSGPRAGSDTVLPCLRRDRPTAQAIGRLFSPATALAAAAAAEPQPRREGRSWGGVLLRAVRRQVPVTPYDVEALSFGVSLLVHTAVRRPHVLVVQDVLTARVVHAGRRFVPRWRTKALFINGAPWPAPYPFADVVQHVTPVTWDDDPADGWEKVLLPLGTVVAAAATPDRARFGIPEDAQVVVSVGTLLDHHKRHVHLIRELARLPEPRPFLVIAGAPNVDQALIEDTAAALLGDRQRVMQVAPDEVPALLACADAFVLASVREGFGLVYLEALAAGLPTIAHDDDLQRWILGDFGTFVDMTRPGALAEGLAAVLAAADRWSRADARRDYVDDRFSWRALGDDYVGLIRRTRGARP